MALDQRCEREMDTAQVRALRERASELLRQKAVSDPPAWSRAVAAALCAARMSLTPEHFALVFAFIEKESSFVAHGLLPDQPHALRKIAYPIIDDVFAQDPRAFERLIGKGQASELAPVMLALLRKTGIADAQTARATFDDYYQQYDWHLVRTEWDLEHQFVDDINEIAQTNTAVGFLLRTLFDLRPSIHERLQQRSLFRTVGPLQVSIAFAQRTTAQADTAYTDAQLRKMLYTIEGGVYFGTRRLKGLSAVYRQESSLDASAVQFIAIDYTGGRYRARNAALIDQLSRLGGVPLAQSSRMSSAAEWKLLLALAGELVAAGADLGQADDASAIAQAFQRDFFNRRLEQSKLYSYVKTEYSRRFGEAPAYASLPDTCRHSYKGGYVCLDSAARRIGAMFEENCAALGCS